MAKQRLSAEETRNRCVEAGLHQLAEHGLTIGFGAVTLEQAVKDSDVSRSSAYAAWSTDDDFSPQELFQRTVLKRAVAERTITIARTHEAAIEVVERMPDAAPAALFRELCRVAGGVNAKAVANSRSWQLVVALRAVLNSNPDVERDDDLAEWMSESEELYRRDTIDAIYTSVAYILGLRPKPEYGERAYHYGEIAAAALAEGLGPRYFMRSAEYLDGIERTNDDGSTDEWSLFSIAFESIVLTFMEPIDPATWHG
ncbi:MAG: hypothetical protein HKN94_16840 [Acidimicrobiales bacterium]|nr:hypothetical protein [Acidimicrobiia bacterium]NNC81811.1 hypothetical protein [Acidimicrobiales bacterium]RZV45461.1 MAG: hypothetical protein EX269_09810 [Acidimicrobiales bacterium]